MRLAPFLLWLTAVVSAETIAEINGDRFISPLRNKTVTGVAGLVLAKGPNGIWIRSATPDDNPLTSEAVYVFDNAVGSSLSVGDAIILDGQVFEFRSDAQQLFLTEIKSPKNVKVVSKGNKVDPLVVGHDTPNPPTVQFTSLDKGDVFGVPNGANKVSEANPVLDPAKYGMDFWESLSGQLVTVQKPTSLQRPNSFGDTWVVGDWPTSGRNKHDGLTMSDKDANPEAIIIGSPLDGSKNPKETKMGDQLEDITGVVTYAFGFYRILPLTSLKIKTSANADPGPTTLKGKGDCRAISIGDYNVENLTPKSAHLPKVANHIAKYLGSPDLVFVQEIQDNNGATNDAVVDANVTLTTLVEAIKAVDGVTYDFVDVDPVDDQDGGEPGGNIRVAYIYRSDVVKLYKPNPGGSTDANEVLPGPALKYNPGRIDPANPAWTSSRKPVVAAWKPVKGGKPFFTVNVHFGSKGGSTSIEGEQRPPINGALSNRLAQATVTGEFISKILKEDSKARVIAAGDFNEFTFVEPMKVFKEKSGLVDMDEATDTPATERYTYVFDMSSQELDHMYVSPALAGGGKPKYEHVHVNSWASASDVVSDHDPSVALLDLCGCA